MKIIALIPARSGSKRIPNKNIKDFFGHPLMAYTIKTALDSGIFDNIYVSSESRKILDIAEQYGAAGLGRTAESAKDDSPDIDWIQEALKDIKRTGLKEEVAIIVILRPTNPFRTQKMLVQSMLRFIKEPDFDSMRAVEPVKQHPYKMWLGNSQRIKHFWEAEDAFAKPTQSLQQFYVQNASLEIIWLETIEKYGNVHGFDILPYFTKGYEGFDINDETDWILAEELVKRGLVRLPNMDDVDVESMTVAE